MTSKLKTFGFFGLCFGLGLSVFFAISEDLMIQRDPAAIGGKVFQISTLSSDQIKQQLIKKLKVQATIEGQKSLRLDGFSSAICKSYSNIQLTFVADGIAVEGVAPEMVVTAPCESGQDPAEMASVIIPIEKILSEKPRNAEFRFDGFTSRFQFTHTADEWPRTWILKSVGFQAGLETNVVQLNHLELNRNQVLVLEF